MNERILIVEDERGLAITLTDRLKHIFYTLLRKV
jgi:hypothetical protein